jgi:hypothetical protein
MPRLNRNNATTIQLTAGERISLTAGGTIIGAGLAYDFTQWALTLGPFNKPIDFVINAMTGDIEYTISNETQQAVRFEHYVDEAALPAIGSESVIYRTQEGAFIWSDQMGAYYAMADALNVPVLAAGESDPVVSGSTVAGQTLTCTTGDWLYRPTSYAYQWWTDALDEEPAAEIEGATASTLLIDAALEDYDIYCEVLATNAVGDAEAVAQSNTVGPVTLPE